MRLMLLGFLVLYYLNGNAQYRPMAVENAQWVVYDAFEDNENLFNYFIDGDTTVAGTDYKKVYSRMLDHPASGNIAEPPYVIAADPPALVGLVRDDTLSRKVYGIVYQQQAALCESTEEQLLYDFLLGINDTLQGCLHYDTAGYDLRIIDSIGTTTWRNIPHRTQHLPNNGFFDRVIEGIGGDTGPFTATAGTVFVPGVFIRLTDYCIGTDTECGLQPTSIRSSEAYPDLRLFPNPATTQVQLQLGNPLSETATLRLTDATGVLHRSEQLIIGITQYTLTVDDLPPGFYTIMLSSAAGRTARKLMVR